MDVEGTSFQYTTNSLFHCLYLNALQHNVPSQLQCHRPM